MDMQNVSNLEIPEGEVRTIHDKDNRLLWGRVHYDTKYAGDTFQQTYSGKNLFNITSPTKTADRDGLKIDIAEDGKITLDGTVQQYTWPDFIWGIDANTTSHNSCKYYFNSTLEKATMSITVVGGTVTSSGHPSIMARFNDDGNPSATIVLNNITTQTVSNVSGINRVYLTDIIAGTVFNNFSFYVQIESGSQATSYEPYVGGTASPNPDYPQDIDVVTGEQTVKVTGKNLIDLGTGVYSDYGFTWTRANNTIIGSGKWDVSRQYGPLLDSATISLSKPLPAGTYTLSCEPPEGHILELSLFNSEGTRIFNGHTTSSVHYITFTLTETATGIRLFCQGMVQNTTYNLTYGNIQIEVGSTPTTYEPYQGNNYPISLTSKNLIDNSDTTYEFSNVGSQYNTVTTLPTGLRYATTYPSGGPVVVFKLVELTPYKGKVVRMKSTFGDKGRIRILTGASDASNLRVEVSTLISGEVISYTVPNDLGSRNYLFFDIGVNNATGNNTVDYTDLILTIDNDDMTYVPYFTTIELCKIGTYQDYIYKSGDDWYVHKATKKETITSVSGTYSNTGSGYYGASYTATDMMPNSRTNGYCNRFTAQFSPVGSTQEAITYGVTSSNLIIITMKDSRIPSNTLANWDSWLASNNLIVCYPLATPTDTKITDNTLIGQLEAIHEWLTRYGYYGNVSTSSASILPMIIDRTNLV